MNRDYPALHLAAHSNDLNQEEIMAKRRITSRNRVPRRPAGRAKKTPAVPHTDTALSRRLQDLTERIDIVLPEMTARVAALEHLLLELKVCTMTDLRQAREFVRLQEA
jgi:hypothetical protein